MIIKARPVHPFFLSLCFVWIIKFEFQMNIAKKYTTKLLLLLLMLSFTLAQDMSAANNTAPPVNPPPPPPSSNAVVLTKGACDLATDDIRCRYDCGPEQLQPMCISGQCYCTNVGLGSCKTGGNSEGCIAICQHLGKTSRGCFEGECNCDQ
ncbi:MAG: hypothetical protein EXX96DRAFT_563171 [Benjaminiella poitrasii]|nr:MAG: hypothetical protein EXX96DRAFT_563171 [Benjaminiella poitrasii]